VPACCACDGAIVSNNAEKHVTEIQEINLLLAISSPLSAG